MANQPGPVMVSLNLLYGAAVDRAVLQGRVDLDIKTTTFYSLLQGLYVWDAPAIGGRFAVGGYLPVGYASMTSSLGWLGASSNEFAFGDMGLIPAFHCSGIPAIFISISTNSSSH